MTARSISPRACGSPRRPRLWQKDLTGRLVHWIEVGQPEERRLVKASGRADKVSVYAFSHGAPAWWAGLGPRRPGRQRRRLARALRAEPGARLAGATQHAAADQPPGRASSGLPTDRARSKCIRAASRRRRRERRRDRDGRRRPRRGGRRARLLVRRIRERRIRQRSQGLVRQGRRLRCGNPRSLRRADRASAARRAEAWAGAVETALAQVLLLDQFTRNAYRSTPRSFAGDARALAAASRMVGARQDQALPAFKRCFVYLPFEHAESLAMQDEAVRLLRRLCDESPDASSMLDYAHRHRAVIERLGRLPHRNDILGRRSTPTGLSGAAGSGF